jgi:type I restriction enzyme S subunit
MVFEELQFSKLLSEVIDNRGKSCPTTNQGVPLIATNCIRNDRLYPTYETTRFVSQEVYNSWFRGHPEPGDILFVNKATPGRVCIAPNPVDFCIAQDMVSVRANLNVIYPLYLFAALRSPIVQKRIDRLHVGSLIPHFKKGDFDKLLIPVPSRCNQEFIGDIYFTLSAKIELNRKQNETLEAMARTLFKAWFVDFEPVRAKLEGRWRRGDSLPGLPAHLYDLFPERLVDSELGEIPEGWVLATVRDSFNLTMGQSPPGDTYNDVGNGLPFFQGCTDFGFRYPENRKYCSAPSRVADAEDTLVSVRAPVGDINLAWEKCCVGRGIAAVRHFSGARSFTYHALWSLQNKLKQFEHTGTVFGAINKKQFEALDFIEPTRDLINTYERSIGRLDDKIRSNLEDSRTLAQLRDTLLPKLISGELRVPDAKDFLKKRDLH